ncbi:MAG: hypothetical protein ACRD6W_13640, partial [Nitrososphaerales archaeon]
AQDGPGDTVLPGLFVDAGGRLCDSPFPADAISGGDATGSWITGCTGFTGAVGIKVLEPDGKTEIIEVGKAAGDASRWATYFGTADLATGTPAAEYVGTKGVVSTTGPFGYTTATRGVILKGKPVLIDVFSGADDLGGLS